MGDCGRLLLKLLLYLFGNHIYIYIYMYIYNMYVYIYIHTITCIYIGIPRPALAAETLNPNRSNAKKGAPLEVRVLGTIQVLGCSGTNR